MLNFSKFIRVNLARCYEDTQQLVTSRQEGSMRGAFVWNLFGQFSPAAVAVISVPILVHSLGTLKFGVLSLIMTLIGYFGLLDFGIGRAMTHRVAQKSVCHDESALGTTIITGLCTMMAVGVFSGFVLLVLERQLTEVWLHIPSSLQLETEKSLQLVAVCMPLVIVISGLRGILEGRLAFHISNGIRIPSGILLFAVPALVAKFNPDLTAVTASLVGVRLLSLIAFFIAVRWKVRSSLAVGSFDKRELKHLLSFGAWMTVSNVISPIMDAVDRFILAATVPLGLVAFYTAPYDIVTRMLLLPSALMGVLFPTLTRHLLVHPERARRVFIGAFSILAFILGITALLVSVFAGPMLSIWLGREFSKNSTHIAQLLCLGVFLNGLAQLAYGTIQAAKRPDITAKFHAVELPLYIGSLFFLVHKFGIIGAAIAWTLRVGCDCIGLYIVAIPLLRASMQENTSDAKKQHIVQDKADQ